MKIIHFADLHLGIESYGILNPQTGLSARLEDFLSTFDRLVEYAISEGIELVLFCGDAYQRKDPSQTYQREFARRLVKLTRAGIPVVLVPGNHDYHPSQNRATSVEIFSVLTATETGDRSQDSGLQTQIYTSRTPRLFNIPIRSGNIQVLSVPWLWRSSFLAKVADAPWREEYRPLSQEALNQEMSRIVTDMINQESQKISPSSGPAILAAHLWITGSTIGSEQRYIVERDYSLLPGSLALPAFDYVALGHIHGRQSLALDPPIAYSGSLERIDFSDEGVPKGFYLVEIDQSKPRMNRETKYQFIELPARNFITLNISIKAEDSNPAATLMQELLTFREKVKDSIVRLQISWPQPHQLRPAIQEIKAALKEAFLIAVINWETPPPASGRLRLTADAHSLTPLDALDEYLKFRQVSPQETSELKSYAEKLLKEIENQ